MAVVIRPRFNTAQIRKVLDQKRQQILDAILEGLKIIGERFVTNARDTDTYKDQTGNLRSSIGYVIYFNGAMVGDNFKESEKGTDKVGGLSKGRELADEVAADHPNGFVLVCVAGMQYAAAVESRGLDVITNSSIVALDDIRKMVARLRRKINGMTA